MYLTKMQGLGNNYLYIYGSVKDPSELSVKLSDRHFGIGADGLIVIEPSRIADFKMRIFNADGSEAKIGCNGLRCVGKYVFDKGYTDKTRLRIETSSGVRALSLSASFGKVNNVTIGMGKYTTLPPFMLSVGQEPVTCIPISMDGHHAVIFVADADNEALSALAAAIERCEYFPDDSNVIFAQRAGCRTLRLRVWEHSSGITTAGGASACAAVAAAVEAGFSNTNEDVAVHLEGALLEIRVLNDGTVSMTGAAKTVREYEIAI